MNTTQTIRIGRELPRGGHAGKQSRKMPATTIFKCKMVKSGRRWQSDLPLNEEQDLLVQARNGSPAAIELLVTRYESRIFRLARNITGNHEDAEEVIQNAFVKAFQNMATFRGDSRFYTWLVRIAVNEALMKVRGRRFTEVSIDQAKESEGDITRGDAEDWGPNPEESYSQEELRKILDISIRKLGHKCRIVFQLRDIEELTTDETARALGLSAAAVKARLARARLQLRNSLDTYFRAPKGTVLRGRDVALFSKSF